MPRRIDWLGFAVARNPNELGRVLARAKRVRQSSRCGNRYVACAHESGAQPFRNREWVAGKLERLFIESRRHQRAIRTYVKQMSGRRVSRGDPRGEQSVLSG